MVTKITHDVALALAEKEYETFRKSQEREIVEGRRVPRDAFIHKFIEAYENVRRIKQEFGQQVELTVVIKDYRSQEKQFFAVAPSLESIMKIPYTEHQLRNILPR